MSVKAPFCGFVASLALFAFAAPHASPCVWHSVNTNEIAKWQVRHNAKDGVAVDSATRTITFLAEASGVVEADPVEFLLIGPDSDRSYESFAVAAASPAAIAAGLDKIGVPRGRPVDPLHSRFWPQGERVTIKTKRLSDGAALCLADMLDDVRIADEGAILDGALVATGGARDAAGAPIAATNMPCAIFALYSHSPSLLQLDGSFDQSSIYGRFKMKRLYKAGELFEFSLSYDGRHRVEEKTIKVGKETNLSLVLGTLRERAKQTFIYANLAFSSNFPLSDAMRAAQAFALVDGAGVRMNGAAPGQFFYRAYMPNEEWRKREGRIYQPFEVHVSADGARKFVFIEEDYSGDGMDPVLKPHESRFSAWSELPELIEKTKADKVNVMFIYAPPQTAVGELAPIVEALSSRIATFYLFAEVTK